MPPLGPPCPSFAAPVSKVSVHSPFALVVAVRATTGMPGDPGAGGASVFGSTSVVHVRPPPSAQRRVRRLASSARLAAIDAGASALRRLAPRRLRRPFLTLTPRRTRRNVASCRTGVPGLRRALRRALAAALLSRAFCLRLAAGGGSPPV